MTDDGVFVICMTLLIILTWGSPDLLDGMISALSDECVPTQQQEQTP